jgi:hypothetical protein
VSLVDGKFQIGGLLYPACVSSTNKTVKLHTFSWSDRFAAISKRQRHDLMIGVTIMTFVDMLRPEIVINY